MFDRQHPLYNKDLAGWKIRKAFMVRRFQSGTGMVNIVCTLSSNHIHKAAVPGRLGDYLQDTIFLITDGKKAYHLNGDECREFKAVE